MARGSDLAAKNKKMAADLRARGIFHGKRLTKPYPNSGGLTMVSATGSAKYQRRIAALMKGRKF